MQSDGIPGDLETGDENTPSLPGPTVLDNVLPAEDSPEDLNTKLSLCSEQPPPDYMINTETELSFDDGKVDHEQEENEDYSAISTGYFPYYRTCEKHIVQPLTCGMNAEDKKPDNDWKDEREGECAEDGGDVEKTTPPSLETDKRALSSMSTAEPTSHELLRDRASEKCLPATSFPSWLLGLHQPFSCGGYFPYYRTEGELCISPALCDRFLTRIEMLENEEGGQEGETRIWNFGASCLVC
ncbi:uncharacterized protein [Anas platyrhynchos]|uniref:uncharacterized protein isoform X1 n=1 Tax=Anas platyrhynchos TaxID=8839 RepID=UPI000F7C6CC6|eukprot:XP_012954097.2 uncharacterized protein LOC106016820 isoform X1 [Anas platyrhynchos]